MLPIALRFPFLLRLFNTYLMLVKITSRENSITFEAKKNERIIRERWDIVLKYRQLKHTE
jgi:hypothetical protein